VVNDGCSSLSVCELIDMAFRLIVERHRVETIALVKPAIRAVPERLGRDGDVKTQMAYREAVVVKLGRDHWMMSLGASSSAQAGCYQRDLVAYWHDEAVSRRGGSLERATTRNVEKASDFGYSILLAMHDGRLVSPHNSDIGHTIIRDLRLKRPSVIIDADVGESRGHGMSDTPKERRYTQEAIITLAALIIRGLSSAHRSISSHQIPA
jgi:hypothetical protein